MSTAKMYYSMTKPGIILGNVMTMSAGFALASRHIYNPLLFLATLIGLSLVIASACVFNNIIDREADAQMSRTKQRALALGLVSLRDAILFGTLLGCLGTLSLLLCVNLLTTLTALFGLFVYVLLYSFSKYYTRHSTLIGSISGAIPPVVGYVAVTNTIDLAAVILFAILTFWQMPHFFAIALYRLEEYRAVSVPIIPLTRGIHTTKVQMVLYVLGFIASSFLLTLFGYTGLAYLFTITILGLSWLLLALFGFMTPRESDWARVMFIFSLVVITGICIVIPFSVIY